MNYSNEYIKFEQNLFIYFFYSQTLFCQNKSIDAQLMTSLLFHRRRIGWNPNENTSDF